jgi:hypothetical protein
MGLPVAGTTIVLYDYWSTASGLVRHKLGEQTTSQNGEFSFDVRKGVYSLDVIPNRETRFTRQLIETVRVASNTVLPIVLKNGSTIAGQVKKSSGEALPFCQLVLDCSEPESIHIIETTDAQGRFNLSVPKGTYQVAYRCAQGEGPGKVPVEPFVCPTVSTLEVSSDIRALDLTLPALVTFKGAVADERGHPVSDVHVTIRPSPTDGGIEGRHSGAVAVCRTSKIGQFECLVEPGLYDVKLEPGADSHLSERQVNSILVDQARTRTLSLAAGYKLSGQVTFENQPVKNCLITMGGGKTESSVHTDADGNYALSLPGGAYQLIAAVQPDSFATLPFRLPAPFNCSISLTEDIRKDISLQDGVVLSGRVIDRQQNPRSGVQIAVYKHSGKDLDTTSGAQRPIAFCIAGDDGSYEFRLVPDKYWLVINNQQSTVRQIEPIADQAEYDLLWDSGCLVDFEIVSEFDRPIPGCQVYCDLYAAAGAPAGDSVGGSSNDAGLCRFAIPSGIYSFRFEPPGHGSFQSKTIRQLSINSDLRRKVRLASKPTTAEAHR